MTTYNEFAQLPVSEKLLVAWVEPSQRLLLWTLDSGAIYKKTVDHFVINVKIADVSLTEATSAVLSAGEWYYNPITSVVYIRLSDDGDPNAEYMIGYYRKFYSNKPVNLPYNLTAGGTTVHYDGLIDSIPNVTQQLDDGDLVGVALENTGGLTLFNNNGDFDEIFDTLFWEAKMVVIYSWNEELPLSEKRMLFKGEIVDKGFSPSKVTFRASDNIFKLRQPINVGIYSDSDGLISDDVIGKSKRLIFGKADSIRIQSITQVKEGFAGTGTISGDKGSYTITGSGTGFQLVHSPGDIFTIVVGNITYEYSVERITNNYELTVSEEITATFSGSSFVYIPENPTGRFNRTFLVSGHKLSAPSTTVLMPYNLQTFSVNSISDFMVGDKITIGSETNTIKRISGSIIVTTTNLNNLPAIGAAVARVPITSVYFNKKKMAGFTVTNLTAKCTVTLPNDVEFYSTRTVSLGAGTISFLNGSNQVTSTENDFGNIKSNHWLRSGDITHSTWYKVLQVIDDKTLELRESYSGSDYDSTDAELKMVEYIGDNSIVTCDCVGLESGGAWIRTASQAVRYLIEQAGITDINAASFASALIDAPYTLSLCLPNSFNDSSPKVLDCINQINRSVFGSLYNNENFEMCYSILSAETPTTTTTINDDDIIDYSVNTITDTYKKIIGEYKHFDADRITGNSGFLNVSYEPDFNKYLTDSKNTKTLDIRLYETLNANTIVQRYALYKSLANSVVSIKGKLNIAALNINDRVLLSVRRMFTRFGEDTTYKLGIVSKVTRKGDSGEVTISDLGNLFNRAAKITANTHPDFASSVLNDKMIGGYIVDNDTEIPDTTSENAWGTNLIS